MHKRISISLDTDSIQKALKEIDSFKKELERRTETYFDELAKIGVSVAQSVFGGATTVRFEKTDTGRKIIADGTDQAYFVEFGTGVHAGTTSGEYEEFPAIVYPGSYSESEKGKGTWGAWLRSNKSPDSYPFNSTPKMAMVQAYRAVCDNAERIAKEVFGN